MTTYAESLLGVRATRPDVSDRIAGFRTLEHVLDWLKAEGLPLGSLDMVTQDEYSHDLLVPVGPDWLAFGMT
jgi:hypothetical protein